METYSNLVECPNCHGAGCGWCENGKIREVVVGNERLDPTPEPETISLQVIHFTCGVCKIQYQVELHNGDIMMVACPRCENTSLQMIRGTP